MNERTVTQLFRDYIYREDLDETLFEFTHWIDETAPPAAKDLVESIDGGVTAFYSEHIA